MERKLYISGGDLVDNRLAEIKRMTRTLADILSVSRHHRIYRKQQV